MLYEENKFGLPLCLYSYYTYYMGIWLVCVLRRLLHVLHRGNMAYVCAYRVITHTVDLVIFVRF